MSSILRYAIVLVASFHCAGLGSALPAQTRTPQKIAPSSVSGRVTIHGKGAPGIVVGIRNADFSQPPVQAFKATTDQDGNYRIGQLTPGNYQVWPMSPAYVNPDLAVVWARGKSLLLAAGEDIQGIDFSLVRGGVITGKVKDSEGRPIIEERVNLVTEEQANSRGQEFAPVVPVSFLTDDRGIYRIYGIPAGRYKISVGSGSEDPFAITRPGRMAYVKTFYPDTSQRNAAEVVEIGEGAEISNIDITVSKGLPGLVASGQVVDGETGQPAAGVRLAARRLINDRDAGGMGVFTATNSKGEFRLDNLIPGKYVVVSFPQPANEVRTTAVPFEVIDQDITGLLVKTVAGLSITGNVVLEGTYDKTIAAKLSELKLQAYVWSQTSYSSSWQAVAINSDGSFRLGGLGPGSVNFSLTNQERRPSPVFSIVRVESEGVEQPRGLEIKPGEPVNGVRIVVRYGSGSIRGEVKLENGSLPSGARIVVWINKIGVPRSNSRPYNPDARGHFLIEGVTAGSYEINANVIIPERGNRPSAKQAIEVSEGAATDVVMTVDLKPDPE